MNFTAKKQNPVVAMRRAGYRFQHHVENSDEMSFVREMGRNGYPRFHAYLAQKSDALHVSIHIDHTKHTHGDGARHGGEYQDDGALGPEINRLKSLLG